MSGAEMKCNHSRALVLLLLLLLSNSSTPKGSSSSSAVASFAELCRAATRNASEICECTAIGRLTPGVFVADSEEEAAKTEEKNVEGSESQSEQHWGDFTLTPKRGVERNDRKPNHAVLLSSSLVREATTPASSEGSMKESGRTLLRSKGGEVVVTSPDHASDHLPRLVAEARKGYMADPFIFQEFMAATKGRDIRAFVCGNKVVACMMRSAQAGSFKANVHQGGGVSAVETGPELSALAIETSKACRLDIAGVDLMMDHHTYRVCEVNSSPGFEGLEAATGIDVARSILDLVVEECAKQSVSHSEDIAKQAKLETEPERKFAVQKEHK